MELKYVMFPVIDNSRGKVRFDQVNMGNIYKTSYNHYYSRGVLTKQW